MGSTIRLAVIGGDGIGPEVTAEALKVLRAATPDVTFDATDYDLGARRFMVALLPTKIPAFAAVGVQSMRDLGVSEDIVNVNGGAIALGHPIGMSGARLALTLALELKRRESEQNEQIEQVGAQLRPLMSWLSEEE